MRLGSIHILLALFTGAVILFAISFLGAVVVGDPRGCGSDVNYYGCQTSASKVAAMHYKNSP
jgi:hypothetical protein